MVALRKLTRKWELFVAAYDGDIGKAADSAGLNRSYARRLMVTNPNIMAHIRARQDEENAPLIATRQDRQRFWTETMKSDEESMRDRLKASELLGKSEADFTEKVDLGGTLKVTTTRKRFDGEND